MPEGKALGYKGFNLLNPFCIEESYMAFDDVSASSKAMSVRGIWLRTLALLPLFALGFCCGWMFGSTLIFIVGLVALWLTIALPHIERKHAPVYAPFFAALMGLEAAHLYAWVFPQSLLMKFGIISTSSLLSFFIIAYKTKLYKDKKLPFIFISLGLALLMEYLLTFLVVCLGFECYFLHELKPWKLILEVIGISFMTFLFWLELDVYEVGIAAKSPHYMNWFSAMGIIYSFSMFYFRVILFFLFSLSFVVG